MRKGLQTLIEDCLNFWLRQKQILNYVMFSSIQRNVSEYVTAVRKLENNLLFESKFEDKEKQLYISKGDIFRDIQEFGGSNVQSNICINVWERV